MKIYGRRSSINLQKVTWCLAELGLIEGRDYQRIDAGLDFGVRNPFNLACSQQAAFFAGGRVFDVPRVR